MKSIERQLVMGATWSLLGTLSSQAIALCSAILLARVLGQQEFGELNVVRITILMAASFVGGGLAIAATKHVAELRDRQPDQAGSVLGLLLGVAVILSSIGAFMLLVISSWIANTVLNAEYLGTALKIGSLVLVTSTIGGVQNGALQGNAAFMAVAVMSLLEAVLTAGFGVAGAMVMGVGGAMLGIGGAATVMIVVRHYQLGQLLKERNISITFKEWHRDFRLLKSVAIPSMLLTAVIQSAEWLGRVLVARGPDGFGQVAIFSAAQSIATITQLGPGQITNASLPLMTQLNSLGATATFRSTLVRTTMLVLLCGLSVAALIAAGSKQLMGLYGETFADNNHVLIVLAGTYGVAVITMVWGAALIAVGQTWSQLLQKTLWGAAMVGATYMLSGNGALGLAYAYAIGNGVLTMVQLVSVHNLYSNNTYQCNQCPKTQL
jgi:O-antigen/teichoic acid export membrane protein